MRGNQLGEFGYLSYYSLLSPQVLTFAIYSLVSAGFFFKVVVTNTYPIPEYKRRSKKLCIIDISGVLAEAIRRTHNGESISYLFDTPV